MGNVILTNADFLNNSEHVPKFKCVNPEELCLLEAKEEIIMGSGIVLMAVSSQKMGQIDVIPKWRVVAVGDSVPEEIGVEKGHIVIVPRNAGRYRQIDDAEVRFVNFRHVLASITYEPLKDFKDYFERIARENA